MYLVRNLCQTSPLSQLLVFKEHTHWVPRFLIHWHDFGKKKQALKNGQCS